MIARCSSFSRFDVEGHIVQGLVLLVLGIKEQLEGALEAFLLFNGFESPADAVDLDQALWG